MISHRKATRRRVREVYLCRQESRLVDNLFRPYLRAPMDAVHVQVVQIGYTNAHGELQPWVFDIHVYLVYHPPGCSDSTSIIGRSYRVQARPRREDRRACILFFFLSPLAHQLTVTDHPVQGYPFFSLLEGPGKTDWMQPFPRLGAVGESLRLGSGYSFWEEQSEMAGHAVEICQKATRVGLVRLSRARPRPAGDAEHNLT